MLSTDNTDFTPDLDLSAIIRKLDLIGDSQLDESSELESVKGFDYDSPQREAKTKKESQVSAIKAPTTNNYLSPVGNKNFPSQKDSENQKHQTYSKSQIGSSLFFNKTQANSIANHTNTNQIISIPHGNGPFCQSSSYVNSIAQQNLIYSSNGLNQYSPYNCLSYNPQAALLNDYTPYYNIRYGSYSSCPSLINNNINYVLHNRFYHTNNIQNNFAQTPRSFKLVHPKPDSEHKSDGSSQSAELSPEMKNFRKGKESINELKAKWTNSTPSVNKYSSLEEFTQSCPDPLQYLTTMKGKRLVIRLAKHSSQSSITLFLCKIKPCLISIMKNHFGNYFCQGFLCLLNSQQRNEVWDTLTGNLDHLVCHEFANHSIQKLIDLAIEPKEQLEIESLISPYFREAAFSQYGTHLLQKIITNYHDSSKEKLVEFVCQNIEDLLYDSYGVCLVKKYIIHLKIKPSDCKKEFVSLIRNLMPAIVDDFYAHYAVLCMIEEWHAKDCDLIFDLISQDIVKSCTKKFTSRIVSKLIQYSDKVSALLTIY